MPKREEEVLEQKPVHSDPVDIDYLPEELQEKIRKIFDRYFEFGFVKYKKAPDEGVVPSFPNKISSLASGELGDLQSFLSGWHGFTIDKLKYVTVCKSVVDMELDKELNSNLCALLEEKGNLDLKIAKAKSQEGYTTLLMYRMELDGLHSMIKADVERYEKQLATISREIARRESNAGF